MNKLTVLTLTFHQKDLVDILIRSFEKYRPENLEITYVVVENSNDTSYKEHTESLAKNVRWFNNPDADVGEASTANGMGIEFGKHHVKDEWTFVCHNDVAVTDTTFFEEMFRKVEEGYELVGVVKDNSRIEAVHVSGYLTKTNLLQKVDARHNMPILDVGDRLTEYFRENDMKYHVFRNTENNHGLYEVCNEPYHSLGPSCGMDRCLNSNDKVMFIHLGRGAPKSMNKYFKPGKITYPGWVKFCNEVIL